MNINDDDDEQCPIQPAKQPTAKFAKRAEPKRVEQQRTAYNPDWILTVCSDGSTLATLPGFLDASDVIDLCRRIAKEWAKIVAEPTSPTLAVRRQLSPTTNEAYGLSVRFEPTVTWGRLTTD
jgi:hypothetical protein